ncbi:uncharacterized protein LOC129710881 isoform X2 [Leucoraja erinacea]|uniref:uncharacterized protein LOC129710881 isoform X2 n=1 Tax=Leucoraja erinaceus TaxID=7782 RepID=UPI002455464E|nr:uncharacterized protein LOC129710881 isoform X2 [Leucoraja erinacea]
MARAGGLPARRVRITWIPACPPAWPMRTVSVRGQAVGLPAPPMRRVSSDQAPSPGRSHGRPRPPSPAAPGLPGRSMAAAAEAEHRTPSASVKSCLLNHKGHENTMPVIPHGSDLRQQWFHCIRHVADFRT